LKKTVDESAKTGVIRQVIGGVAAMDDEENDSSAHRL
jgi:hypothetical protein